MRTNYAAGSIDVEYLPNRAAPFSFDRRKNASFAAGTFAAFPFHALSTGSCSALP